jgi:hypothetical protein
MGVEQGLNVVLVMVSVTVETDPEGPPGTAVAVG